VRSLEDADPNRARILVVDEIGKMELFSDRFVAVLRRTLEGGWPLIGSLMAGRNPIADSIRGRPDVQVVEVTTENRQKLPSELAAIYAR
jgi:nucleoside-triphosphatase